MLSDRVSGSAGLERVLRKINEIQERFEVLQDEMVVDTTKETFRSHLDRAKDRHSTDGKTAVSNPQAARGNPAKSETRPAAPDSASAWNVPAPRAVLAGEENRLMEMLRRALPKSSVPPDLALAVMQAESQFNPRAVSPSGAIGLMQVLPSTARDLGVTNAEDLFEPETNVNVGLQYLSNLLSKYKGNEKLALAAYNAGPGAVDRFGGVPPYNETRAYIDRVMSIRSRLNEGTDGL